MIAVDDRHRKEMLFRPADGQIWLWMLGRDALWTWGKQMIAQFHYLVTLPDPRTSLEGYAISIGNSDFMGLLTFGRPQAQKCKDWYGSVEDVRSGRCEVTRWQVLNLSRLVLHPDYQTGGKSYLPEILPGFVDRFGNFQSTLASAAIREAIKQIGFDYLTRRPPVFLDEPYEITYLMSYHDTRRHRGVIYEKSGFEKYGDPNEDGIQTWRLRLPLLNDEQHRAIQQTSKVNRRAQEYRARRSQMAMDL